MEDALPPHPYGWGLRAVLKMKLLIVFLILLGAIAACGLALYSLGYIHNQIPIGSTIPCNKIVIVTDKWKESTGVNNFNYMIRIYNPELKTSIDKQILANDYDTIPLNTPVLLTELGLTEYNQIIIVDFSVINAEPVNDNGTRNTCKVIG